MSSEKIIPDSLTEITVLLENIELLQREQQNALNTTQSEIRTLKKVLQRYVKKEQKYNKRRGKRGGGGGNKSDDPSDPDRKPRKPCGFQLPTSISDEMCDFIGSAKGVLVPRTDITKFITKYISENHLQNPESKKFILPDAKLAALLGPEAVGQEITHFTIHRYLKRHFPPSKKSIAIDAAANVAATVQTVV